MKQRRSLGLAALFAIAIAPSACGDNDGPTTGPTNSYPTDPDVALVGSVIPMGFRKS